VTTPPLLEVKDLSTHFVSAAGTRVVRAVNEVSFTLHAGETLGIVGESGSGKSTLALTILRILPPAARIVQGQINFEGENLLDKSDSEMQHIRGKRIAMILQDPMASLNPLFSIGDQVAEPMRVHEHMGRGGAWRAPRNCSVRSGSRRRRPGSASTRTRCPAACASGSSGPSRSPASRRCSSPTSRRPASTSPSRPST
jgi:ABC-type dipeptide/oligopeptide/nickel transport system ATPase component